MQAIPTAEQCEKQVTTFFYLRKYERTIKIRAAGMEDCSQAEAER
jgi:hypothetical protein